MTKRLLIGTLLVAVCCSLAPAEVIQLKSGKTVEGKILERTDTFVKMDTGIGVPVTYFKDEIEDASPTPSPAQTGFPEQQAGQIVAEPVLSQIRLNDAWPTFLIGQDVQSIDDFLAALKTSPSVKDIHYPNGIMAYTAINDVRGLSESVDHGAGVNFVDESLQKYPVSQVVQIGLYMKFMLKEVVSGGLDDNITKMGRWIKNCNQRVYLRIGYEFDNPDNEYDPEEYIHAYRYVVDHLRKMDIPNVYFVWHTIAWRDPSWPIFDPMKWFPGDDYVDWVGISFFDSQRDEERETTAELARKLKKPLMIAESSPFNQYTVEGKLQWIRKLFKYIHDSDVQFLSYINVNWDVFPLFESQKWGDARLENSPPLMAEWLKQIEQYRGQTP